MQRLGHQAEAATQRGQFGDRRGGQGDIEIAASDLVGRRGKAFDRLTEATGETVRGDETDQQHRNRGQAEQAGEQRSTVAATQLGVANPVVRGALHIGHQAAQLVEGLAQRVVFEQGQILSAGQIDLLQKTGVGAGDCLERLPVGIVASFGDTALERLLEGLA